MKSSIVNRLALYTSFKFWLDLILLFIIYYIILSLTRPFIASSLVMLSIPIYQFIRNQNNIMNLIKPLPVTRHFINKELCPSLRDLEDEACKHKDDQFRFIHLPNNPINDDKILEELDLADNDIKYMKKLSGSLYITPAQRDFKVAVYQRTAVRDLMYVELWPKLQDIETQTIGMCLNLYHASKAASGLMTAGGTLSIFTACLAYRNRAENFLLPVRHPEIIVSDRAHPAFKKSCQLLKIKQIVIPSHPETFKADVAAMEKAITPNTILLVGSAPTFSEGIIDDLPSIAQLAQKYDIGFHVDACLGGFLLPFAQSIGVELPPFDFRLPGVSSISVDFDRYGMSEKGHSAIMFYDFEQLGQYPFFTDLKSNIGMYLSLGIEGSRPARVDAWASMLHTGFKGYADNLKKLNNIKNTIVHAIKKPQNDKLNRLQISGNPLLPIFAIRAKKPKEINALLVASQLKKFGWQITGLPNPPGFLVCLTPLHLSYQNLAKDFLGHLNRAVTIATICRHQKPKGTLGLYDLIKTKVPPELEESVFDDLGRRYLHIISSPKRVYTL